MKSENGVATEREALMFRYLRHKMEGEAIFCKLVLTNRSGKASELSGHLGK